MKDLHTNPDGSVTAEWSGREVQDARRGFYLKGKPLWRRPGYQPIVELDARQAYEAWLANYRAERAAR
jgi:hypothetical protein